MYRMLINKKYYSQMFQVGNTSYCNLCKCCVPKYISNENKVVTPHFYLGFFQHVLQIFLYFV